MDHPQQNMGLGAHPLRHGDLDGDVKAYDGKHAEEEPHQHVAVAHGLEALPVHARDKEPLVEDKDDEHDELLLKAVDGTHAKLAHDGVAEHGKARPEVLGRVAGRGAEERGPGGRHADEPHVKGHDGPG